jgi:acyl-CoA thioester hydrolase
MNRYSKKTEIRWSDIDPNFHVLHSRYYDYAAFCRMSFLTEHGVTTDRMIEHHTGPILFREECIFKREIRYGDEITITMWLDKLSPDHRKWTFVNEIFINGDTLAAVVTVDGAWMDTKLRKVTVPPDEFKIGMDQIPKTENFNRVSAESTR